MIFERLELVNFSCYYHDHVINFETTPEKPVAVIVGSNGAGKTSIFDAINWSLYGGEYEQDLLKKRKRKIEDYVNLKALKEAFETNNSVEMSCTLFFEHENTHYYISQSLCVKPTKNQNGDFTSYPTDRITALYRIKQNGDHINLEYNSIFLDEMLPSNVKDYFLFDGDRIYQLSNPGSSQQVRDAIYRVVDLELIKSANVHLSKVAAEFRASAKQHTTGELTEIETEYTIEREKLEKLKKELNNYRGEEGALRDQIDILEEKLSSMPDTSKLQAKRQELDNKIKINEEQTDQKLIEIRSACATASLALSREHLLDLVTDLDAKRQKGQIPRAVSKALITDILNLKRCICETKFIEGDEIFNILTKRLDEETKRSNGQELLEILFQLKSTSDNIDSSIHALVDSNEKYNILKDNFQELNIALKQVDNELEKLPKEDITIITNDLRNKRNDLVTLTKNITLAGVRIEECDKSLKNIEDKRIQIGKKQANFIKFQRREYIAQQAANLLEGIFAEFAEDSRKSVETLTKKEFYQFMQSAINYDVALDENYELVVLDENHNRALQRLSMGQSQCLSLSFITAISRVSEKNPPLVIDMPFGRLDPEVYGSISKRLPEITSQLILFLLPVTEWNDITKANLQPKANHIYNLIFDKKTQTTEIEDGSPK